MLRDHTTITRATAVELRLPDSITGRRRRTRLIQLDGVRQGRKVHGIGEVIAGSRRTGQSEVASSWRALEKLLDQLEGKRLPSRSAKASARVPELIDELTKAVPRGEAQRGTVCGIEVALLDLAARAAGVSLGRLLGGPVRRPEDVAVRTVDGASSKVISVSGLTDLDRTAEVLAAVRESAGPGQPLWLELGGPFDEHVGTAFVELLIDKIKVNVLTPHVIVRCGSDESASAGLIKVQAIADSAVPPSSASPGIVLMADAGSQAEARDLAAQGIRGLNLDFVRLGGMLAVRDVASELGTGVRIALSTRALVTRITAHALLELSASLPRLDYIVRPETVSGFDVVVPDGDPTSPSGGTSDRLGLGLGISLVPVVGNVTRRVEVPRRPASVRAGQPTPNVFDLGPVLGFATVGWGIPLTNHLLERSALEHGLNTMRVWNSVFVAEHDEMPQPIGFAMRRSGWTGMSARRVADDKELVRRILDDAGVPVPRGMAFRSDDVDGAVEYAKSLAGSVVVKPRGGSRGVGVATDLRSDSQVRSAVSALFATPYRDRDFIVEEYIAGDKYRFLVVGDRVVSVVVSRPASVVGDSVSTIVDLVLAKNLTRLENPHTYTRLIELGSDAEMWIDRQGLTFDSVPIDGREVQLGSAGNIASGGDSIEVLDETHESMLELAVRATHSVPGLDHCGVDVIGDHRRHADEQRAVVIEINSAPVTLINHYPMFGTPRDASTELVRRSCELSGYALQPARPELSVRIQARMTSDGGYQQWFARLAGERNLAGFIGKLESGVIEAHVSGRSGDVAAMASRAFIGPPATSVECVRTTHVANVTTMDGFEVHDE